MSSLNRREFLGTAATATMAAAAKQESVEARLQLGNLSEQEQMDWLLGVLDGRDLMTVAYDSIVQSQAAVIRDTSVPLPTRMETLREMFDHSLTLSELQQPYLHAAHEKYGVDDLLLGRDPIFFQNDAIRRWWKRESARLRDHCLTYADVHEQRQMIGAIVQNLIAHKEAEAAESQQFTQTQTSHSAPPY